MRMDPNNLFRVTDVVLFSGGWESTLCALRAREACAVPNGVLLLFFNYQQQYLKQERAAVEALSEALYLQYREVELAQGLFERQRGVVVGRNEHFIRVSHHIARTARHLWFGCRAPSSIFDKYKDSNMPFAQRVGREAGYLYVNCPAVLMRKSVVRRKVLEALPRASQMVFSSEGLMA